MDDHNASHASEYFKPLHVFLLHLVEDNVNATDEHRLFKVGAYHDIIGAIMAQIFAVTLIRRNRPDIVRPYRMALYPATSVARLWDGCIF